MTPTLLGAWTRYTATTAVNRRLLGRTRYICRYMALQSRYATDYPKPEIKRTPIKDYDYEWD